MTDSNGNWNASVGVLGVGAAVGLVIAVVFLMAYVRILHKAGYSGWWLLIGFVPVLNVIFFLVFAFADWPTTRRLRALEAWASSSGGGRGRPSGGLQEGFPGVFPGD